MSDSEMTLHDEVGELFGGFTSATTNAAIENGLFDDDADCGVDPEFEDAQYDEDGDDPFSQKLGANTETLMNDIARELEAERIGREMKKAREEAEAKKAKAKKSHK